MALFPEEISFKNSAESLPNSLAEISQQGREPLVPGELFLFRESAGFRLYSLSISGSVVQVGARIKNENKGSLTVTNFGEGSSSFVLNDGSVTTTNIPDASITGAKLASPLSVEKGGTGQSTQATAINALLPSQAGNADKVLGTDGASLFWDSKKSILNDYDNVNTVSEAPASADCLRWNSVTSSWVPDQDIQASVVPASATDTGRPGQLAFDSSYLYSCVGVNRWKRAPLSTWNYAQILPSLMSSTASVGVPTNVGPPVIEFVGAGTTTSGLTSTFSVPWPANHRAGDIGMVVVYTSSNVTPSSTGWTLIAGALSNGTQGLRVFYKYATTSSEPNALFTWSPAGNYNSDSQMIAFRNVSGSNPVDTFASLYTAPAGVMALQPLSVTTTAPNCAVLYFLYQGGTCGTAGGCQSATTGTLEPALYYDREEFQDSPSTLSGSLQLHAGRKFQPGIASTGLTYTSSAYTNNNAGYQITIALKQRPGPASIILPPAKDTVVVGALPKAGWLDPLFPSVSLRYPMNGANGSTTFTDLSVNNNAATVNNTIISTAQSKFGGSSALFNGTNSSLQFASPPSNISTWWGADSTIEYWVWCASFNSDMYPGLVYWSSALYCGGTTSSVNSYWAFGPVDGGSVRFTLQQSSGLYSYWQGVTGGTITLNTWHHVAMTHVAAERRIRIFTNGNLTGDGTWIGSPQSGPVYIGRSTFTFFNGYIDDFRYTHGTARYTTSFTPPTAEFPIK